MHKFAKSTSSRLLEIRNMLGVQNAEFAQLLGRSKTLICFYMYNSGRTVPPALLEKAEQLVINLEENQLSAVACIAGTEISALVENWMKLLEIDTSRGTANEELAKLLKIDRTTVWRWKTGKHKPRIPLLLHTHLAVIRLKAAHRK